MNNTLVVFELLLLLVTEYTTGMAHLKIINTGKTTFCSKYRYEPVCNLSYILKAVVSRMCSIGPCRVSECHAIRVTAQHGCLPAGRQASGLSAAVHCGHASDSPPANTCQCSGNREASPGLNLVTVSDTHITPIYFCSFIS
jgi:hypothetical protein